VIGLQTATVVFDRQKNHFSQLLNVCGVNVVRQTEIHTPEPLLPEAQFILG